MNEVLKNNQELLQTLVQYGHRFIHRQDCYPIQLPDGSYRTIYEPLNPNLLNQHIKGQITLGTYALDAQSQARWLCLDADKDAQWDKLWCLAKKLENEGIQSYLEPSRRGGHLWLFTPLLAGKDIRRFGLQLIKANDLEDIELYPKQDRLTTGVGSLVRLPLGIHRKSGKRYHFISTKGEALAPSIREQMVVLANPQRIPQVYIDFILSEIDSSPLSQTNFDKVAKPNGETVSERIKNAISVYDFVSRYVALDSSGRGFCPFHEDSHESFQVHAERNFWHCYSGCGGGSIIDFWMKWRGNQGQDPSFKASIKELADMLFG